MAYRIDLTESALQHLQGLSATQRALVLDSLNEQLSHQPATPTRNRKKLRPNDVATWELRIRDVRVYYDVLEKPEPAVMIGAIGVKVRERVYIAGREIDL